MSADSLLEIHTAVLALMRESGPKRLAKYLVVLGDDIDPDADLSEDTLRGSLVAAEAGDVLLELWRRTLKHWDHEEQPRWSAARSPVNTADRRAEAYGLLGLGTELRKVLDEAVPVAVTAGAVVISKERPEGDWYRAATPTGRGWYWPAYEKLLLTRKGWTPDSVAALDEASTQVVERLADPASPTAYQARGLVVGYVQSGKTANFTGVAAKAVDAGYRLVIVLGGTLNLLRQQTQRRLDMELVGQENILRGADPADPVAMEDMDYVRDDKDWLAGRFLSHGGRPSELGAFDIERLTTRDNDYKSLLQGITALEFEKREPALPLYDPRNLHRTAARLMVVKKNKSVLSKLVKDLKKIRTPLGEIPALIIDDESDQASVNTSDPKKTEERTAINGLISELIRLLPRAQYVGYTATPFANVFIDPSDGEDIFPRDFIVSLPRPDGYMGVQDFHDLDSDIPADERNVANSQEKAHVRGIFVDEDGFEDPEEAEAHADATHLREALDMYVLTAAMKLYREAVGAPASYRHHTMLVHESVRQAEHRLLADRIRGLWHSSDYYGAAGHTRLQRLFETDIQPVSAHHAEGFPVPDSYAELQRHVGAAVMRIGGNGEPVLVVNGDKDIEQEELDFNSPQGIWKILVGGTKLSRGFTVEDLTVTYYRRTTSAADTMMQMGRWFGFRRGYRDLVRLYIGRSETLNRSRTVDLYEAFEAICRDEESFRTQLAQYATPVDGRPQLTPAQVPPLVAQHLPWIKPSARNKMFNAELVEIRSPGQMVEPTAHPVRAADLRHNTELWRPLLDRFQAGPETFTYHHATGRTHRLTALVGSVSPTELMRVLENLRWWHPAPFAPHLEYLRDISTNPLLVDDWLLIAPQQTSTRRQLGASILGSRPMALSVRQRRRIELFGSISDPKHRATARRVARSLLPTADPVTESYSRSRRGAVLLYPVIEEDPGSVIEDGAVDPSKVAMVFSLVAPASAIAQGQQLVRFRTIDSAREDSAIIEAAPSSA